MQVGRSVRWVLLDHAFLNSSIKHDYHMVKLASPKMFKRIWRITFLIFFEKVWTVHRQKFQYSLNAHMNWVRCAR